MDDTTTVLVPIRFPLTDGTRQTLAAANRIAEDRAPAHVTVMHVNLLQNREHVGANRVATAVSAILEDVETSVITRNGFLVEEAILEEATQTKPDVVVIGSSQTSRWRRLLRQLSGNDPDVGTYLRTNLSGDTEVVEVGRSIEQSANA